MKSLFQIAKRYIIKAIYRAQITGSGKIHLDKDYLKINKTAVLNLKGNLVLNANRMGKNDRSSIVLVSSLCTGRILFSLKVHT